jgi:hypothetical protein
MADCSYSSFQDRMPFSERHQNIVEFLIYVMIVTTQALSLFCINALSAFQNLAIFAYMLLKLFGDILNFQEVLIWSCVKEEAMKLHTVWSLR